MSNGGSGISIGGSLNIDSNVVLILGAVSIASAALAGVWLMKSAEKKKENYLTSYHSTAMGAHNEAEVIAQRLVEGVPTTTRPAAEPAFRRSVARHGPKLQDAIRKMRTAQIGYRHGRVSPEGVRQAISSFAAVKKYVTEEAMQDVGLG